MRPNFLFSIMFLIVISLLCGKSFSQTSNFIVSNDVLTGKVFAFDIAIQSTEADPIEFATATIGFQIPDASRNGGTITGAIVAGSSQLTNTTQVPTAVNCTGTVLVNSITQRLIKIAGKTPPSAGNGSMLTTAAGGTRLFRLALTNTADWVITGTNSIELCLGTASGYPSSLNYYISGVNTNEIALATYVKDLSGPLLPVELSTFGSNVNGRQINLNWETKTEVNFNKFEIERSLESTKDATVTWASVGSVQATGNSNSPKKYSFAEKNLQAGKYQYRLKMIDNDGTFKYSSVQSAEVAMPKEFAVSQNYPNPFNPTTTIAYQVPVDAKVIMEVYNIAGQKVSELVNQDMSAGYYTANFGASNLSSGVYIYRVVAIDKASGNNFSSIKKMMLLK